MKKLSAAILCCVLLFQPLLAKKTDMKFDGKTFSMQSGLLSVEKEKYISLDDFLQIWGKEAKREGKTIRYELEGKIYVLQLNDHVVTVGKEKITLPQNIIEKDEKIWLPLSYTEWVHQLKAEYNPEFSTVVIYGKQKEHRKQLKSATIEELYQTALKNNLNLKDLQSNMLIVDDKLAHIRQFLGSSKTPQHVDDYMIIDDYNWHAGYLEAEIREKNIKLEQEIQRDKLKKQIMELVSSILYSEKLLDITKSTLALQNESMKIANISRQNGFLSSYQWNKENQKRESTKLDISELEKNTEALYQSLNMILNVNLSTRYQFDYEPEKTTLSTISIEQKIKTALSESLQVKQQKNLLESANFSLYVQSGQGGESLKTRKENMAIENRKLMQFQHALEKTLRENNSKLMNLDMEITNLLLQLSTIENEYAKALIEYRLGNLSKLQLDKKELERNKSQLDLWKLYADREILFYSLQHEHVL